MKRRQPKKTGKKTTKKIVKKQFEEDYTTFLDDLIKDKKERFDDKFKVTPKGLLFFALANYVKECGADQFKALDNFVEELLAQLSLLATDNKEDDLFGKDFNQFFNMVIKTINSCGKMAALLEENGIEYHEEDDFGKDK